MYAETDIPAMLHRVCVEYLYGTGHRQLGIVGMGAVQLIADYDTAVQMFYREGGIVFPLTDRVSVECVLDDVMVVDGIYMVVANGYGLPGRGAIEAKYFFVFLCLQERQEAFSYEQYLD